MFSKNSKIFSVIKSALLVVLALAMALSFAGCNNTQDATNNTGTQTTTNNAPTTTRVPTPDTARETLNTYLEFIYNANGDVKTNIAIVYPDAMLRDYLKQHDMSEEVFIQQLENEFVADKNRLKAGGLSYKFEIKSETAMTAEDIESYNKGLSDLGIKVSEGMTFDIEITEYVNDEVERTFTRGHDAIKIGSTWHIPG